MNTAGRVKYSDLVDVPKLQALMESFSEVVGIANAVIDVDGTVIVQAGWQDACADFHRANPESCRRCIESDTLLAASMTRSTPIALYRCLNGLADTAARIMVEGAHLANVFTGQFLTAAPDLDFFRQQARQFGFDEASYLDAIGRLPILPRERVEAVTRLYAQLAGMLADNGLDRLRQIKTAENFADLNNALEEKVAARTLALARANEDLAGREALLKQILDTSSVAIFLVDAQGRITQANQRMAEMFGYPLDELIGSEYVSLVHPAQRETGREKMLALMASASSSVDSDRLYWRADHTEFWGRLTGNRFYEANGEEHGLVGVIADITVIKAHQKELEHIAQYDALTNLPNRVLLADRLQHGMAQARQHGQQLAVAYLDLDGFKAVNDQHGHDAGDQLLVTVATRMRQALREGDTLARIGGDEFVAVLLDLQDVAASMPMLTRLLAAAAQPVQVGDLTLQVSASLGVTFYPQAEEVDADQLLRQADQAMYQAKLAGKNRYHVFDAEQDRSVRGHHASLEHIRHALAGREFVLYYQPKVNMRTGAIIGAEALIRWQHPQQGLLPPAAFLPAIEDHPLAVDIGEWVIDTALRQMAAWKADGLDIPVSVNVGARQLQQPDFALRLRQILAAHPAIRSGYLELEVLETSALEDLARVSGIIEACRELGVSFALDDFGTGYSSLTYLKRLPISLLKIDQSFVRDMLDDPDDLAILEGVIGLATAFHRQVIAEGVETVEHGEILLQLGCELAQGYGIARPMPAADLPRWAAAWQPDPAWVNLPSVSRDDFPLLFASVEHRAWIAAIASHLQGTREAPPPLDHHQCRFGMWLEADGLLRYGAQPAFQSIEALHRQVHALATELCELKAAGRNPEALARLDELHRARDVLLEQLSALMHKNRQQANARNGTGWRT